MSEAQIHEVEEWLKSYDTFQGMEREQMVRNTQMTARAMALTTQGVIPMHTDLDWTNEAVQTTDLAGLRKGH